MGIIDRIVALFRGTPEPPPPQVPDFGSDPIPSVVGCGHGRFYWKYVWGCPAGCCADYRCSICQTINVTSYGRVTDTATET